jgi:hypothetical protein
MFRKLFKTKPVSTGSGIGLKGGDRHYRAFVGPPHCYDLMSAMVFNLLTCVGLRQHHVLLDIGCGSLRVGRLLIPYLNKGCYVGVEPEEWLVRDGILNELGQDMVRLKSPRFVYDTTLRGKIGPLHASYALAQSIFTHCSKAQITGWLRETHENLGDDGVLLATYFVGDSDYAGEDWVYPDCSRYRPETIKALGEEAGFRVVELQWTHPRNQTWVGFAKPAFDTRLIAPPISWNRYVDYIPSE